MKRKKDNPNVPVLAFTIQQFCASHNISIDTYHRIARAGTGPKIMKVGHKTLISVEAAVKRGVAREKPASAVAPDNPAAAP